MKFQKVAKQIIPPFILGLLKQKSEYGWHGDYPGWREAKSNCKGYENGNILEKVKAATLKVTKGEAVYERDSVLFDKIQYSYPLLSGLMWVAAMKKGKIHVIDFGGSLGSTYFQNKQFLDTLEGVRWSIIEQPSFVSVGRELFQDEHLQFFNTVDEAIAANGFPDILIICCTLPYIEKPYDFLHYIVKLNIPYLMIDNTPFNYKSADRITIQKVPPSIYEASYPCWLLNYDKVVETIAGRYCIISEHYNESTIFVDGRNIQYRGLLAKNKNSTNENH